MAIDIVLPKHERRTNCTSEINNKIEKTEHVRRQHGKEWLTTISEVRDI
jgi:hypothetical protein